jgi:hypothetical protein
LASKAQQFREHRADELDGAAMYRSLARRPERQLLVALTAAMATFGLGRLVDVSVS